MADAPWSPEPVTQSPPDVGDPENESGDDATSGDGVAHLDEPIVDDSGPEAG